MNTHSHEYFIRICYDLASSAAANGNHPFGALLVHNGDVLLTAENSVYTENDPTRHAELNLVSRAARQFPAEVLAASILYTSTEPCAMCCGGIFWAGVPQVVFGCSSEALGKIAGKSLLMPSTEIFGGARPTTVVGPVLEADGIQIHEAYWK